MSHSDLANAMLYSTECVARIVLHMVNNNVKMLYNAINIGANDGITLDLLHILLYINFQYRGLCIESHKETFNKLKNNIPSYVDKLNLFVTPNNISKIISKYHNIDIISIDIDSFDYIILQNIIKHYPKIIIIELNENIPPGITYYVNYGINYDYSIHGNYCLFGCSLDAVTTLAEKYSYKLLSMDWNNAILIHNNYAHLFYSYPLSNYEAYSDGYYYRENRDNVFFLERGRI